MHEHAVSFRPRVEIPRVRWGYRTQLALGVLWTSWGAWQIAGDGTFSAVIGAIYVVLGLGWLCLSAVGRRAGLDADARGLRWRGILRSTDVRWEMVERLVVEDRGMPHGTKVGIDIVTVAGEPRSVPQHVLAGLAEDKHAGLRRHVLAAIARCAEEAGVPVIMPDPGDPLVP